MPASARDHECVYHGMCAVDEPPWHGSRSGAISSNDGGSAPAGRMASRSRAKGLQALELIEFVALPLPSRCRAARWLVAGLVILVMAGRGVVDDIEESTEPPADGATERLAVHGGGEAAAGALPGLGHSSWCSSRCRGAARRGRPGALHGVGCASWSIGGARREDPRVVTGAG